MPVVHRFWPGAATPRTSSFFPLRYTIVMATLELLVREAVVVVRLVG